MDWINLPLFLIGVLIFAYVFDRLVFLAIAAAILMPVAAKETEQPEPSARFNRAALLASALLFTSFALRALPVGVAIRVGTDLRPQRWVWLWLLAGFLVSLPHASGPIRDRKDVIGVWTGRLVVLGAIGVGFAFPTSTPDFVKWIATKLVV